MDAIAAAAATKMSRKNRPVGRWFYFGMGLVVVVVSVAGFGPSMVDPSTRNVPLPFTPLVTTHAILASSFLLLFLTQSALVVVGRTAVHRRLGIVGVALTLVILLQGYVMSVEAARRGFDLTRTVNAQADPVGSLVTRLGLLLEFGTLVLAALWYRRRPEIHRRLLLLGTVGPLTVAPIAHFVHHWIPPDATGLIRLATAIMTILLLSASGIHDGVSRRQIHPVSLWVPIVLFVWQVQVAVVFPTRAVFREFAAWLIH
jgi:hypothetical protein